MFSEREAEVIRREMGQLSDEDDLCTPGMQTTPLALPTFAVYQMQISFSDAAREMHYLLNGV
eukprot:m.69833 g.69833  ORF g.69833 m.69833 type:complete len:62 (-) comp18432_c0_seq2:177-362(-)